jgi:hypothetical protein
MQFVIQGLQRVLSRVSLAPAAIPADEEVSWPAMQVDFATVTVFLVEPNQAAEEGTRIVIQGASRKVLRAISHAQVQCQNPLIPLSR